MVAAALCVAGLVLGDIDRHFAWQAWHLVTSTFTLRGLWHLWHWAGSGDALVRLARVARAPRGGCGAEPRGVRGTHHAAGRTSSFV